MPERQCVGCKKQVEWGCEAYREKVLPKTAGARPDQHGNWWLWHNPARLPMTVDDEESYACPRQDLKERPREWSRMLMFYGLWKKGHLPQGGSVLDQSNRAMELFQILDAVNAEADKAQMDQERERRAKHHGGIR
jgi:hypothetical protein